MQYFKERNNKMKKNDISKIYNQLSRESQNYIFNIVTMAKIAEEAARKESAKPSPENPPNKSA